MNSKSPISATDISTNISCISNLTALTETFPTNQKPRGPIRTKKGETVKKCQASLKPNQKKALLNMALNPFQ